MKILLIEDEKLLADSVKSLLERKGFQVECVYDGESGKEYAELGIYDLLILDVMMPKMDGFEVARQVRKARCNTPILMLTARSDVQDRIAGLNAGADYYLTKPFDSGELLASINALLRRQGGQVNEMVFGNTALDLSTSTLSSDGKTVRLSAKEFDVMRLLLQAGKRNLSKSAILSHVLDLSNAHVSVEIDGGKASGSMEDIGPGTYVTVTVNGKGEATYVLVSTQSFFGGRSGK